MKTLTSLLLATLSFAAGANAQGGDIVNNGAPARRATEAVIWGIPLVNYDRMLQAAIENGGAPNQVIYWSQPVNSKNQTLTPNPDTIYLNPFYDTRKGPVVLEIPPAGDDGVIVGSVDISWQNALIDVGPAGADKGKGGKYLITPPGHKEKPPKGYIVLPSDTYLGFVILRSNFKSRSPEDIAAAVAHGKKIKFYPLGASPDSTVFVDVHGKDFDSTIPYDLRFFEGLDRMVQIEPWQERDRLMIPMLKSIGIEKGKPFHPDGAMKKILGEAIKDAHAEITASYESNFADAFYPGTHWAVPVPQDTIKGMNTMFEDPDVYAIDGRAVMYSIAYFSPKHLGPAQFYVLTIKDGKGGAFDGKETYKLTVPADAPAKQYWSVTAYDAETHALIKGMPRASRASNVKELQKNSDGSTDLYFGPQAPEGKESNWVPTDPQRGFELMFRIYGPDPAFFEKKWKLPDAVKVEN
ncbi:DUF1254 domain-containing protein [Luteolibacter luteus]|uniref:DUF1254 domain-containing protein n=1 Tax=Luteolibacter luteus TaxID=2728835 RepID=A0A858RS99_9BACT|nr:DUF1254 domain-containing protein [Luteolibacter luteus]QJE98823.1 DUF1254 domain-containing protein [Luteolibacter luteus]